MDALQVQHFDVARGGLQGSIVVASGCPRPLLLLLVRRCALQVGELPSLPTCFRA